MAAGVWMVAVGALCCRQVVWRAPKFQVPLSPLAPCAAILADVFLIVSLGPAAHLQFGVWTALAVLAYAVYGVHSTPDVDAGTAGQGESELVMGHEWSSQEGSRVSVPGMSVQQDSGELLHQRGSCHDGTPGLADVGRPVRENDAHVGDQLDTFGSSEWRQVVLDEV